MAAKPEQPSKQLFLGIECGGTRTVALLADGNGRSLNGSKPVLPTCDYCPMPNCAAISNPSPGNFRARPPSHRHGRHANRGRSKADTCRRRQGLAARPLCGHGRFGNRACRRRHPSPVTRHPHPGLERYRLVLLRTQPAGPNRQDRRLGHVLGDGGSGYEIGLLALKALSRSSTAVTNCRNLAGNFSVRCNSTSQAISSRGHKPRAKRK